MICPVCQTENPPTVLDGYAPHPDDALLILELRTCRAPHPRRQFCDATRSVERRRADLPGVDLPEPFSGDP